MTCGGQKPAGRRGQPARSPTRYCSRTLESVKHHEACSGFTMGTAGSADRPGTQEPRRRRVADARPQRSVPGASLHIDQGSNITVQVTNDGDAAATVDWHGLRLDNRHDGVRDEAEAPIPIGRTFTYRLRVP